MDSTVARAFLGSLSSSSSSMTLPWRTSRTPEKPRLFRAWPMAVPCGSSTPDFKVTWTRAFMGLAAFSLHCLGTFEVSRSAFRQDAKPTRHFLVGLLDIAEIAAEAVLIEFLVRFEIPEPAGVRADLIGEN